MPCIGTNTSGCDIGTIYVIGDVNTLAEVFIGLSTIFGSNEWTGGGTGLGSNMALAMIIALMVTAFKTIVTQKMDLHFMLVSVIIFNVFFVPTMPLQVVDYSSGRNSGTIMGVPVGIGMIGHATGTLSYYLTEEISENFTGLDGNGEYTTPFKDGFLDPLVQMLMVRKTAFNTLDSNLNASMLAYWKNCLSPSEKVGVFDYETLENSPAPIDYMFSHSNINNFLTVHYDDSNSDGYEAPCHTVANILSGRFNSLTDDEKGRAIQSALFERNGTGELRDFATYERSINAILGYGADAQEFMVRSMMANYVSIAKKFDGGSSNDAKAYAAIVTESVEKERIDSAAEATLFLNFMQPMLSVLMFLFYASSPIMAIIIMAVPSAGMQKAGMYLLFGVWVHSWMPFAAIVNSYIQNSITHAISDGNGLIDSSFSLNQLPGVYNMVANKLSAASNIMTAVSVVSLALIAGSPFAMAQLGNRFSNNNKVNSGIASPDIASVDPVAKLGGQRHVGVGDKVMSAGLTASDSLKNLSSEIKMGEYYQAQYSKANEAVTQTKAGYEQAIQQAIKAGNQAVHTASGGTGTTKSSTFSASEARNVVKNALESKGYSWDELSQNEQEMAVQDVMQFAATGNISAESPKKGGIGASGAVSATGTTQDIDKNSTKGGEKSSKGYSWFTSEAGQNTIGHGIVNTLDEKVQAATEGKESLSSQKEKMAGAKEDYQTAKTRQDKYSQMKSSGYMKKREINQNAATMVESLSNGSPGFGGFMDNYLSGGGYDEFKQFTDGLNNNNYQMDRSGNTAASRMTKGLEAAYSMKDRSDGVIADMLGISRNEMGTEANQNRIESAREQARKFMDTVGELSRNDLVKQSGQMDTGLKETTVGGIESTSESLDESKSKVAAQQSKVKAAAKANREKAGEVRGKAKTETQEAKDSVPQGVAKFKSNEEKQNYEQLVHAARGIANKISEPAVGFKGDFVPSILDGSREFEMMSIAADQLQTGGWANYKYEGGGKNMGEYQSWDRKGMGFDPVLSGNKEGTHGFRVSAQDSKAFAEGFYNQVTSESGVLGQTTKDDGNISGFVKEIESLVNKGVIPEDAGGLIIASAGIEMHEGGGAAARNVAATYLEERYADRVQSFKQDNGVFSLRQIMDNNVASNMKSTEAIANVAYALENYDPNAGDNGDMSHQDRLNNFKGQF